MYSLYIYIILVPKFKESEKWIFYSVPKYAIFCGESKNRYENFPQKIFCGPIWPWICINGSKTQVFGILVFKFQIRVGKIEWGIRKKILWSINLDPTWPWFLNQHYSVKIPILTFFLFLKLIFQICDI